MAVRVRGHDASAPGPRAKPHRVASAMPQDGMNRALRVGGARQAGPAPSPGQPHEGSGPCTPRRIDAETPSPVRPDQAGLGLLPPPVRRPRWWAELQSGQALLPFRPPPLLVVQSSFRSPSAWLLALYSNGDKAGVSPIIGTEGRLKSGGDLLSEMPDLQVACVHLDPAGHGHLGSAA